MNDMIDPQSWGALYAAVEEVEDWTRFLRRCDKHDTEMVLESLARAIVQVTLCADTLELEFRRAELQKDRSHSFNDRPPF